MRIRCYFLIIQASLVVIFYSPGVIAQYDSSSQKATIAKPINIFSGGLGIQHGFIFAHSPTVENTKGSRPTGVEMILSCQRKDPE